MDFDPAQVSSMIQVTHDNRIYGDECDTVKVANYAPRTRLNPTPCAFEVPKIQWATNESRVALIGFAPAVDSRSSSRDALTSRLRLIDRRPAGDRSSSGQDAVGVRPAIDNDAISPSQAAVFRVWWTRSVTWWICSRLEENRRRPPRDLQRQRRAERTIRFRSLLDKKNKTNMNHRIGRRWRPTTRKHRQLIGCCCRRTSRETRLRGATWYWSRENTLAPASEIDIRRRASPNWTDISSPSPETIPIHRESNQVPQVFFPRPTWCPPSEVVQRPRHGPNDFNESKWFTEVNEVFL